MLPPNLTLLAVYWDQHANTFALWYDMNPAIVEAAWACVGADPFALLWQDYAKIRGEELSIDEATLLAAWSRRGRR